MKKIILITFSILFYYIGNTQVSFKGGERSKLTNAPNPEEKKKLDLLLNKFNKIESSNIADKKTSNTLSNKEQKNQYRMALRDINDHIDSLIAVYYKKRLFILAGNDAAKEKQTLVKILVNEKDSLIDEKKASKNLLTYWRKWDHFEEERQSLNFFPAYYSTQAIRFFEDDSTHLKLFQNNLINYSPKTKKMTLHTEAVNDYLGPFRIGIGFQIQSDSKTDSLNTVDSTQKMEKKENMLSDIQNGGGDLSINVKYPIVKSHNLEAALQYKFYLFGNTGFSLPVLDKSNTDFLLNYNLGIEGALYTKGFKDRITFYAQIRGTYYNGNKNFQQVIKAADKNDPTSFMLFQTSLGLDFLDGYRLRVDLYNGNRFVRKNFPATVTFIVRPGK